MGVGRDIEYQLSLIKREKGESNLHLAKRLYYTQMDVLSANAARDLIPNDPKDPFQWDNLDIKIRLSWIEQAKNYE